MITLREGKPGEGMSWKTMLRIVGMYLRKRPFHLTPAQAQMVLNAMKEEHK